MSEENTPREKFAGLKFSHMKGCDIKDSNKEKIGNLQDAIFKWSDGGFILTKFLIGGSRWEELLEDIGLRPDIDPVFPINAIEAVSPKSMRLNIPKDRLKSTTDDENAIEEGEFKLSELGNFKLLDASGEKIGDIMDVTFSRNNFQFIVGDGFIKELAEDTGLLSDVDLLLETSFIETFSVENHEIRLTKDKLALKETFEKHIPSEFEEEDTQFKEVAKAKYFPRSTF